MTTTDDIEHAFPSTTWEWRKVKIKRRPQGSNAVRAKRGRWSGLRVWPRSETLTIRVKHRGGSESWWLVESRGQRGAFPGWMAIEDVMSQVCSERSYHER